ncbi:MAG: type II toxin-antitoxin system prevent-host-death family antitoxin [Acidimicrobiaceae bacterium]|nr:type II toxin-antitoxin system prevent-host-death family antitoxin [Acidimicrobiaceae bacterium]
MSQVRDAAAMDKVVSRDLRNQTRALLDRVAGGESLCITVHGRPVAELRPIEEHPQWMNRERFVRDVLSHQADPGLLDDLADLKAETTDDLQRV